MSKRRRLLEWGKTLLILLLAASALYLGSLTLLPGRFSLWSHLFREETKPAGERQVAFLDDTLRPAALAVTWSEGRCAFLSDQADIADYPQLSTLLAEALSAAQTPQPISQVTWQRALNAPGVYWEYLGPLPLDHLTRWLAGQDNPALRGCRAQRILVSGRGLYFCGGDDPTLYTAPLTSDLTGDLDALTAGFSPNGARFAFQDLEQSRSGLRSDTLLLADAPTLPILLAEAPLAVADGDPNDALARLLQLLSFHPQTNPLYDVNGGWAINDGGDTLRVSTDGAVTFRQPEDQTPRFSAGEHPLDTTRTLAEQTLAPLAGEARLYLRSWEERDGVTTVTYGYAFRGAPIQLGPEGWCARFVLSEGAVTELTLRPRRYTLSGESATLLPQQQAAAAHRGEGTWSMGVFYEDRQGGAPLAPFWAQVGG